MLAARRRPRAIPGAVRWGFAATLVLALGVGVTSIVDLQRARREVRSLAVTADRSTFLVGDVGRQVARLRAEVLERTLGEHPADPRNRADEELIEAELDRNLAALEPLLQPDEREQWDVFLPLLARFRTVVHQARAAFDAGDEPRAMALLGETSALATRMQEELDVLGRVNQQESQALLAAADRRLSRVRLIQLVLDVLLLGGLTLIWWTVLRTIERQERTLDDYLGRIEQSNRDLDAFAGRIAHDLRNTLAPLTFLAARLRAPVRADGLERMAAQLDGTVRQSRAVLDGLLAFSRGANAGGESEQAPLAAVVRAVLDDVVAATQRAGIRVEARLDDVAVPCPPGLAHVVAANLIGNAVKFVEGSARREVRVAVRRDGDVAELVVEDTGPGIPRDALPRIWEPFYRAAGVAAPGTGIGLATVRRIVDAHGGTVEVALPPAGGTRFTVRLPVAAAPPDVPAAPEQRQPR